MHIRGATDDGLELTASETGLETKTVQSRLNLMNSRFCKDVKTVLGCSVTWGEICSAAPNPTVAEGCSVWGGWYGFTLMLNVHYVYGKYLIYMYGYNFKNSICLRIPWVCYDGIPITTELMLLFLDIFFYAMYMI